MAATQLWRLGKSKNVPVAIPIPVAEDGSLPERILIFKYGTTNTENGPYTFNDVSRKLIEREIKRRNIRWFSDWHHASLDEAPRDPRLAAAASSHYDLEFDDEGMWAVNIDWTPEGADDLKNKRYMYISPAFDADKKTGVVMSYRNFALTNDPATHDIAPLIAAESQHNGEAMDEETKKALDEIKKTLEAIGKSHEETAKKLAKLEESHGKLAKKLGKANEEDEEDEEDEEEDESRRSEPTDPDGDDNEDDEDVEDDEETERRENESDEDYEKRMKKALSKLSKKSGLNATINRLTRELARAQGRMLDRDTIKTQVHLAVKRGLVPKWMARHFEANPRSFLRLMAKNKKRTYVPPTTETRTEEAGATTETTLETRTGVTRCAASSLSAAELQMCKNLHLSPEEYLKSELPRTR